MKNYAQNVVDKLVPDPFLKNQHRAYSWIGSISNIKWINLVNKVVPKNYHYNTLFSLFLILKTRHQAIFYQPQ